MQILILTFIVNDIKINVNDIKINLHTEERTECLVQQI